jgi:hypothetical protein
MGFFGFGKKKKKETPVDAPNVPAPFVAQALPSKSEVASMEKKFIFSKQELTKLKARYKSLVDEETGKMEREAFCSQAELACCGTLVKLCMDKVVGEGGGAAEGGGQQRVWKILTFPKFELFVSYRLKSSCPSSRSSRLRPPMWKSSTTCTIASPVTVRACQGSL